ncbi:MAG: alanine dehydrogenase, partial [Sphingobacterium sp.]
MVDVSKLAQEGLLQPKEALWAKGRKKDQLTIGIPKENSYEENRVPLTPLSVGLLVENGHDVVMETGAGDASNFLDHHYSEQGALIVYDKK